MGEILAIIVGIIGIILCVAVFLFVLWASLIIGGIGGFFIGIFSAFKNYIVALIANLNSAD